MERYPLYYNPVIGGYTPMTTEDTIPYSLLPTLPPDVPKQAILTGTNYLTSSGLTLSVAAGLSVSIGQGATDTIVTFDEPATVGTLPANSTRYIYVKPDKSFVISSIPYCVVDGTTTNQNANVDSTSKRFGVNGQLTSTTMTTADNLWISGNTTAKWGLGTLKRSCNVGRYGYFEGFIVRSSSTYTHVGVAWVSALINLANNTTVTTESAMANGVVAVFTTTTAGTVQRTNGTATNWTIHDSSTIIYNASTTVGVMIDYVEYKVYIAIDGVWRNSGNPVASFTGTPPTNATLQLCVSSYGMPGATGSYRINDPPTYSNYPVNIVSYCHHDKSSNTTYTVVNGTQTIDPMMYLGRVVTGASTVTAVTLYPLNNTYTIHTPYAAGSTSEFTHNLATFNPNVSLQLTTGDEVMMQFKDNNTLAITPNKVINTPITVTT